MSIRDRVKHETILVVQKLMEASEAFQRGDISWEENALYTQAYPEEILSIDALAVVDRKQKVPTMNSQDAEFLADRCNDFKDGFLRGFVTCQAKVRADYVMEVKE